MSDIYDVPDHESAEAAAAAAGERRRTKQWLAIASLIILGLVVGGVWLFTQGFGGTPAATATTTAPVSAETSQPAQAEQTTDAPPSASATSSARALTADDLDEVLLSYQELRQADLGLDAPSTVDTYAAQVAHAEPASCALMIETVAGKPAGFASESAIASDGGQVEQRVYLVDSAAEAAAVFTALKERAATCQTFSLTAAGADNEATSETFESLADSGHLTGLTWKRTSESPSLDNSDDGWRRVIRASNVIVELEYLGPEAAAAKDGVFQLFSAAETKLTDALGSPGANDDGAG